MDWVKKNRAVPIESGTAGWKNIIETGIQACSCVGKPRRTSNRMPSMRLFVFCVLLYWSRKRMLKMI
jgi:hypothetical protein